MGTLQQGGAAGSAAAAANDSFKWSQAATALSGAGQLASGIGGLQLGNYQAAVAAHNASIMAQNAAASLKAGEYTAESTLEKGGQIVGREQAGYGASNIDVNVGSPKQVEGSTRTVSSMDAAIERFNAAREAYGQRVGAAQETAQASIDKSAGVGSLLSGISGAGSTLVGGASSLAGKYRTWQLGVGSAPPSNGVMGP